MQRSAVTMLQVAKAAGVDKSTVSLALRGHGSISQKRREAIAAIAERMGYKVDRGLSRRAAAGWKADTDSGAHVLGYLDEPDSPRYGSGGVFHAGLCRHALAHGYRVKRFNLLAFRDAGELREALVEMGVRGIILPPMSVLGSPLVRDMDWSHFTVVCCAAGAQEAQLHYVGGNLFDSVRLLWGQLMERGYERIGCCLHPHDRWIIDDHRQMGAFLASEELEKKRISEDFSVFGAVTGSPYRPKFQPESLLEWMGQFKPDAIIASSPLVGQMLFSAGVRVPDDVGFCCLMAPPKSQWTGIQIEWRAVAEAAVELLMGELCQNHWGLPATPHCVLLHPVWQEGETLPRK